MIKYYGTKNFFCWLSKQDDKFFVGFGNICDLNASIEENLNTTSISIFLTKEACFNVKGFFKANNNISFHVISINSPEDFDTICKVLEVIYG